MDDYVKGERFIAEEYRDFYQDKSVIHAVARAKGILDDEVDRKVPNKFERIDAYLMRLEEVHSKASTLELKNYLKRLYYDEYVVKWEDLPSTMIDSVKNSRIEEQKKSLDKWIDFLTDENISKKYPMWLRYFLFQEVVKIGAVKNGRITRRTQSTFLPFIDLDYAMAESWLQDIKNKLENVRTIDDIRRVANDVSFLKMYKDYEERRLAEVQENNEGRWVCYQMGNEQDAQRISSSLQGTAVRWCTKDPAMAHSQICGPYEGAPNGGDFYVFYTKNREGEFVNPRIAIRMSGKDKIGEIRGSGENQELENVMINPLMDKLESLNLTDDDKKQALNKVNNLHLLQTLSSKTKSGIPLSREELLILYTKFFGFGFCNEAEDLIHLREFQDQELLVEFLKEENFTIIPYLIDETIEKNIDVVRNALLKKPVALFQMTRQFKKMHTDIVLDVFKVSNGEYGMDDLPGEILEENVELVRMGLLKKPFSILFISTEFKRRHQDVVLDVFKATNGEYGIDGLSLENLEENVELVKTSLSKKPSNVVLLSNEFKKKHQDIVLEVFKKSDGKYGIEDLSLENLEENLELVRLALLRQPVDIISLSKEFKMKHQDIVLDVVHVSNGKYGVFDLSDENLDKNIELVRTNLLQQPSSIISLSKEFKRRHQDIVLELVKISNGKYGLRDLSEEVLEENIEFIESLLVGGSDTLMNFYYYSWYFNLSKEFKERHQSIVKKIVMLSNGSWGFSDLTSNSLIELRDRLLEKTSVRTTDSNALLRMLNESLEKNNLAIKNKV